ncbi:sphingomyelin phosphodiesterase, partial [Leptospira santarosai]|nr:sphingomyelin phosphodiesterase [Leptospira santarosai]MDI7206164.1 sphingomyelin phosphodiesterase [Leptospira santarosai]
MKQYTKVWLPINCCLLLFFLIGCGFDRRSSYIDLLAYLIYISDNKNTDSANSSPAENSIFENSESVNSISENTGIANSIFRNSESSSSILDNFESATVEIKILSHNVFLLPKGLPGWGNWGQNERAERIASSNYIRNQDVIVFDEAFDTN